MGGDEDQHRDVVLVVHHRQQPERGTGHPHRAHGAVSAQQQGRRVPADCQGEPGPFLGSINPSHGSGWREGWTNRILPAARWQHGGMDTPTPDQLLALDAALDQAENGTPPPPSDRAGERVRPHVGQWYLDGTFPARDLAKLFGSLGLLGMHLQGYGCAGTTATMYGVACRELEAVDSGIRSLVSVQGSLTMFPIHRYGSEEQKKQWLPGMAAGELVGCFGLTEPDAGSDPSSMRTRARRDGSGERADWVLDGTKMWITNAPIADVAVVWARTEEGVRGFLVPTRTPGFGVREVTGKLSLRAAVTGEITLEGVRLPHDAVLPGALGLRGALSCLNEARYGIALGRGRRDARLPDHHGRVRRHPGPVRPPDRRIPAHPGQAGRRRGRLREGVPLRATPG